MGRPATQHEEKKAEIIQAAIECFARYGFEGTTNKLIAKEAGLNSASLIYHYFPSKTSLFEACLNSFRVMDDLQKMLENEQGKPPEEYLTLVGMTYQHILRDPRLSKFVPMFIGTMQSHQELIPLLVKRIETVLWLPISKYLKKKTEEGILKPIPAQSGLQIFLGPIIIRLISPAFLGKSSISDGESDEEFIKHLVDVFLQGAKKL